jgi:ankyrin repeat protein
MDTKRLIGAVLLTVCGSALWAQDDKQSSLPAFDYEVAVEHEIQPHRHTISLKGVESGENELVITLTVSPAGDVIGTKVSSGTGSLDYWPQVEAEVRRWKFTPFEKDGKAVTAEVQEYVEVVPPERLPSVHVAAPVVRADSTVKIVLQRSGCFGSCPSYKVAVSTNGIVFEGGGYVAASGKHTDTVNPDEVRDLAKRFAAADFYSLDSKYEANVTDSPGYNLSIEIDGRRKEVDDYVGSWVGMPAVVTELEDAVDKLARTERWIKGGKGLVGSLESEKYDFRTFDAQVVLKEAATRGQASTVGDLLAAGVPLQPFAAPKPAEDYMVAPFDGVGWLNAASGHLEVLQVLIEAGASKDDQNDKDLALAGAAASGNVESVRALIAYGANPNADLSKLEVTEGGPGMTGQGPGAGSVLIYAAASGDPEVVREILRYHPNLEAKDRHGETAIFAAAEYRYRDKEGARVECVRLLAASGANVNARDEDGNTPLHESFLTDVLEELLKLGADVNARNNDGETPIFRNVDDAAIPLFIAHGADLTIRNSANETVIQAAEKDHGPSRVEALKKAIEESNLNK